MTSGTNVAWSNMITRMVRTSQSSCRHHCPMAYHHTWLAAITTISTAVRRRSLRLDLTSTAKTFLCLKSRYTAAISAMIATAT
ncbi:MAG: hypothetical protein IKZ48_04450 [Prevotella sp.]|nr:hypothetical protein [Prevotella sp.]